jgi:hypothetical protein
VAAPCADFYSAAEIYHRQIKARAFGLNTRVIDDL